MRRWSIMAAFAVVAAGGVAAAQDPVKLPEVKVNADRTRTLRGTVFDTSQVTVDGAEISIPALKRRTLSRADGTFQFDDLPKGTFDVRARKLGYGPRVREIKLGDHGGGDDFALVPIPRALPPMTTSSTRLGLSGVVADTGFNSLANVFVRVMGVDYMTRTDSVGGFFMPVPSGSYLVSLIKAGFGDRVVSVTIPEDSGRRITAYLQQFTGKKPVREAWNLPDLNYRMAWRTLSGSMFFTREELEKLKIEWVLEAVTMSTARFGFPDLPDPKCAVVVDGGPGTATLGHLTIDDIETIEIYGPARRASEISVDRSTGIRSGRMLEAPRPSGVQHTNTQLATTLNQGKICPTVYVWMR